MGHALEFDITYEKMPLKIIKVRNAKKEYTEMKQINVLCKDPLIEIKNLVYNLNPNTITI